ncbi:uncharacterized protein LOC111319224 [Stylophora pistillata]|uniref:Fukutin-related protein n=1 Tax=Stylophora pistillata TaxID=50429 RepID=A0A2B4R4Q2_STYPI|nr:uncharacterized protein LOC111319224 [Stylophora pistillata]PFX11783.1 Fukutin-related protein [Stylophora pistillata]
MRQRQFFFVVLIIMTLAIITFMSYNLHSTTKRHSPALANDLRRLAVDLSETQRSLVHLPLQFYKVGESIQLVKHLIKSVDGQWVQEDKVSNSPPSKKYVTKREVCPEKYMGKDSAYGFPFYRKGFEGENCTDFVPIDKLVTMVATSPKELSQEELQKLFEGIATYYPRVPVIFMLNKTFNFERLKKPSLNLSFTAFDDLMHGATWSKILKMVTTPYALFAPDIMYFTDDVNLERLVRVLSENRDTIIAGGSHKNQRGEWDNSCRQVQFRNWTAYFADGYYHSFNDCIACDVLLGPFMTKTKQLQDLGIDQKLHFGAFHDLFWRLKLKHPEKVVVSCPDVMFDTYEPEVPDEKYDALVKKWDVKKWVESNGRVRWYGCRRGTHNSKSSCGIPGKGFTVPPCDLENLADIVKFIMRECENTGIHCQLNAGTLLGAVKFKKILPWERDADVYFISDNYTAIQKLRPRFEAAGYTFKDTKGTECCTNGRRTSGIFLIYGNGWKVDFYGRPTLEAEILVANGQQPTKVMLAGQWVTATRNPGLVARNRYGPNMYHHVEHWSIVGNTHGDALYKSGVWNKCPKPGHTGCLNQFQTDGDRQFGDHFMT